MDNLKNKFAGKWRFILLLALVALLPAMILLFREMWKRRLEAGIKAKLAAIQKAGEPLGGQDIDKNYHRLPDGENSALLYLQASSNVVRMMDSPDLEETNSPLLWVLTNVSPSAPIPLETKSALEQWLTSNSTSIALISQAARFSEGSYPLDLSRGFHYSGKVPLPHREISTLMAWLSIIAANDGHADAAVTSLMHSSGLAQSLRDHPYPIAQMLRGTCLSDSVFALEHILNRTRLTAGQMRELQDSFHRAQEIDWIKRSVVDERCLCLELYGLLPKPPLWYMFTRRGEDRTYAIWHFLLYPQRNLTDYLDIMEQYIKTASLPLPQRLRVEIGIANDASSKRHSFGKWFPPPLNWAVFTSGYAWSQARLMTAEVSLAVERYRLANHGQIPDELNSLVPGFLAAVPTGPTEGQPLRFKKQGDGYVIFTSVLIVYSDNSTNQEDVKFRVER